MPYLTYLHSERIWPWHERDHIPPSLDDDRNVESEDESQRNPFDKFVGGDADENEHPTTLND